MLNFILVAGIIWLLLTLFEPLVAYFDAMAACDRKYAPARARRAEVYAELAALHRQSPVYQQMARQKKAKSTCGKQKKNKHTQKSKRSDGVVSTSSKGTGSTSQACHPYGRIVQHKK